ncbi:unnamed protein product [Cylicostephanus goldi]|uniref:Globin family profile domain-containing protein n=1 Tax=Cylicostephanus goldi TaxID=71465 RepID=A0A3P6RFJ9_CYLGO|nr:unnamed protein product [Cylicostephanus goldi]
MSMDNLSALDPILDNLGRRHGKLEVNGKFRTYYWSTFLECSICIFRKTLTNCRKYPEKDIDKAIILWRYLLRDVMKKIKVSCSLLFKVQAGLNLIVRALLCTIYASACRDCHFHEFSPNFVLLIGYNADISNRMNALTLDDNRSYTLTSNRKESYPSDVSDISQ